MCAMQASESLWSQILKDLELLMMHNRSYAGEIAHNVSTLKRKAIVERASEVRLSACGF